MRPHTAPHRGHHTGDRHLLLWGPNRMVSAMNLGEHLNIVLTVPGLGGSSSSHWQSRWEAAHPRCRRVHQDNWNIPDYDAWLVGLHAAIMACDEPPLLAAHSIGCALLAHWAEKHPNIAIKGALMVAPADVDSEQHTPFEAQAFAPMPLSPLPFPTTVVTSSNDAYVTAQRAQVFATAWGADFVNIGEHAHINADSFLEDWPEGWDFLQQVSSAKSALSSA